MKQLVGHTEVIGWFSDCLSAGVGVRSCEAVGATLGAGLAPSRNTRGVRQS